MQACPYDALYIDPKTHTAAKCNYCAHRIDAGLEPACVNVCPTQAIVSGDLNDPNARIAQLKDEQNVVARKVEKGTVPALFYIDADNDSLDPLATDAGDNYMWGGQTSGVGHFAHDSANGDEHVLEKFGRLLSFGESSTKLDREVATSLRDQMAGPTKRAYDAPQKGILWGWQVSGYLWTKSIAAGVIIAVVLAKFISAGLASTGLDIFASVVGLVFLGLTGALLVWDLDKPTRFLYVLLRPQWKSWLVRGAYIITVYSVLLVSNLLVCLAGYSLGMLFDLALLISAMLTAIYTAFLFAQARGRSFWQSRTVPLHMVTHAVINGAAFLLLFAGNVGESYVQYLCYLLCVTALIQLVITMVELFLPHGDQESRLVVNSIVAGKYSRLFWGVAIAAGTIVPLLGLMLFPQTSQIIAGTLFLFGVFTSQHIWVRAPQQIPLS